MLAVSEKSNEFSKAAQRPRGGAVGNVMVEAG